MDPELESIDAELKRQGKVRADLGRKLGLDSSQVNRLFNGKRRLQRHEWRTIQEWLFGGEAPQTPGGSVVALPNMVPLYGWVGASSESRLTIAEQNLRGFVPMHPAQAHVRDAFALEVADISMSPRYEPGEIVYLAPHRWPTPGKDCVVVTVHQEGLLKRFVRREADQVVLHQLNPDSDLNVVMEEIDAIHSVVGRG